MIILFIEFCMIRYRLLCILFSLLCITAEVLHAVVISAGNGQGNTTAPEDDFGFANIGKLYDGSVIYLGNYNGEYWVMTANHVVPGNVTFGSTTYNMVAGSVVRIKNPVEYGLTYSNTEITMFRISADPGLPNLKIADTPIDSGTTITVAGRGWTRSETETWWNSSWNEVTGPSTYLGYKKSGSTQTVRWGSDVVAATDYAINVGSTSQYTFYTVFDWNTNGMQAVFGDSGGGAFYKDGDTWVLAGLTLAQGTFANQPSNTALYGNQSVFVDLGYYYQQISEVLPVTANIPEPPGFALLYGALLLGTCLAYGRCRVHRRQNRS
jgi:hypothetical protein